MTVVTHHEVVILFESISLSGLAVNEDTFRRFLESVVLIVLDNSPVKGKGFSIQDDCSALGGNPKRSEEIPCLSGGPGERENILSAYRGYQFKVWGNFRNQGEGTDL